MSLETDSYTCRRAPSHLHPSSRRSISVFLLSHLFCNGLPLLRWAEALLFPFIVYYEWYVTRRHARPRKRCARRCRRGFFFFSSPSLPPAFLKHSPFTALPLEKSKIQITDYWEPTDQYCQSILYWCVGSPISFHFGYSISYCVHILLFCTIFGKSLYFRCELAML